MLLALSVGTSRRREFFQLWFSIRPARTRHISALLKLFIYGTGLSEILSR
jgi:hypothetical protein